MRKKENRVVRDNIVFESGLFIGRIGKERTFVIVPRGEKDFHLPTNVLGLNVAYFDPTRADKNMTAALGPACNKIRKSIDKSGLFDFDKSKQETKQERYVSVARLSDDNQETCTADFDLAHKVVIFPIYQNFENSPDWHKEVENALQASFPSLNSRMVYYGPGLAKNWIRVNVECVGSQKMRETFKRFLSPLILKYAEGVLNIIDLGVGDFEKGSMILDDILRNVNIKTLNYVPVDISFEMLSSALEVSKPSRKTKTLMSVMNCGNVFGIHAPFEQLSLYRHLFDQSGKNVFLLLGNTLGNELDEVHTLRAIRKAMRESDIIVTELQLIEDEPFTIEEITEYNQAFREFYAGPFLSLGCNFSEFDVVARYPAELSVPTEDRCVTYEFVCTFKKAKNIFHIGFSKGVVRLRKGSIGVHIIRKYYENAICSIFEEAGFEVLEQLSTCPNHPNDRRFHYTVARPSI